MSRQPISKKLRFEVFKRDSFACQYCGKKAPEVVLHCDHVKPVAEGGPSDILNLITACADCNLGKGARALSDQAVLTKQQDQLAELQERREQIEMMLQWREELERLSEDTLSRVYYKIVERGGRHLNESGKAHLRRWLNRHNPDQVIRAASTSFDSYLKFENDVATDDSWELAFKKIPAFISLHIQEAEKPYIGRLAYIQGIIRKRSRKRGYDCMAYLEHLHLCGMDLDDLERRAKRMRSLEDFEEPLDEWLKSIGRVF